MEHDGCVGCKYENESAESIHCQGCTQNAIDKYARKTNADRIREMTDEELAAVIMENSCHCIEDLIPFCKNKKRCSEIMENGEAIPDEMCKKCLMEWLQKEAEEE